MKMIRVLFMFALVFSLGTSYGQIKVNAPNGDVGVGFSGTPSEKLEVGGNIRMNSSTSTPLTNFVNGPLGNSHRMTLSNSTNAATSAAFFSMKGNGESNGTNGQFTCAGSFLDLKYAKADGNFGTFGLRITATGDVGIGNTAPTEKLHVNGNIFASGTITPSDKRLKNDVQEFDQGLETIMKMNPVSYFYNGEGGISAKNRNIGVIAQELQEIAPYLVSDFEYIEHNDENEIILQETYLKIYDSAIKYILVNAVQEQQKTIKSLTERITKLEAIISK